MNKRRFFLKQGAASIALLSSAKAFSLKNLSRNAKNPEALGQKDKKFAMLIDLRKCVGCHACTASCKVENQVPKDQFRTNVAEFEIGTFPNVRKAFLPQLCNHCENPPCVSVCPTGATFKRLDGIVVVDNQTCWGCGYCVNACPYDKRFINSQTKVVDKCTFCAHRLDAGLLPACVETCVGGARIIGNLNDKNSLIYQLLNQFPNFVLKQKSGTKPQVFYIGLNGELLDNVVSMDDLDDALKSKSEKLLWQSEGV
ncbi:sulfate reduction electron transfer complex DsrMKJOP subunit DsrO [Campylobacter taeniopygiae]|uniref:sulfate reduction electron transfer complex DsrMKJOP subunit DsrO n=1 Tax=Campylobacter taeniopygiae TaxID=2510188 RepID=UPI003D6BECD5